MIVPTWDRSRKPVNPLCSPLPYLLELLRPDINHSLGNPTASASWVWGVHSQSFCSCSPRLALVEQLKFSSQYGSTLQQRKGSWLVQDHQWWDSWSSPLFKTVFRSRRCPCWPFQILCFYHVEVCHHFSSGLGVLSVSRISHTYHSLLLQVFTHSLNFFCFLIMCIFVCLGGVLESAEARRYSQNFWRWGYNRLWAAWWGARNRTLVLCRNSTHS